MSIRLGWSLLILLVMVIPLPGEATHWFKGLDLVTHFALFGILGGLNRDLIESPNEVRTPMLRVLVLLLMVLLPETLQSGIPTRSFSLLDLMMNGVGTGWGLLIGTHGSQLTYLLISSSLLGFSFGLDVLKNPLESVLFGEMPSFLTLIGFLVPTLFVGIFLYRGTLRRIFIGVGLLILYGLVATIALPGSAVLLGGIALTVLLVGDMMRPAVPAETLSGLGLAGFSLFFIGGVLGEELFFAHGGLWVVVAVLLASFVVIVLDGPLSPTNRLR